MKVKCENSDKCNMPCDQNNGGPNHKYEHELHAFCRKAVCIQTGKTVECVPMKGGEYE